MLIKENTDILVLRYNDYRNYDFIDEHKKEIQKNGSTWFLKIGKPLAYLSVNRVLEAGGYLVFKAPKKQGNKYYIAQFDKVIAGDPCESMNYPNYYSELFEEGYEHNGTWLRINVISELVEEMAETLVLLKNGSRVVDVISCTRTPVIYAQNKKEINV